MSKLLVFPEYLSLIVPPPPPHTHRSATSEPCCHRCSEYSTLDAESLNAGFSLSQEAGNAEEPVASASFQFGFESGPLVQYPPPSVGCSVTDARLQ